MCVCFFVVTLTMQPGEPNGYTMAYLHPGNIPCGVLHLVLHDACYDKGIWYTFFLL